jgi:hypothetical protein
MRGDHASKFILKVGKGLSGGSVEFVFDFDELGSPPLPAFSSNFFLVVAALVTFFFVVLIVDGRPFAVCAELFNFPPSSSFSVGGGEAVVSSGLLMTLPI